MKTKRVLSVLLVLAVLIGILAVPTIADEFDTPVTEEPEEPYLYTKIVNCYFGITNGTALTDVSFECYRDLAFMVEVNIKLQKRFLLFWWNDISGGEWNDTIYNYFGSVDHSLDLTSTGEYRAVITVKVYGAGSDYDEINQTLTDSY